MQKWSEGAKLCLNLCDPRDYSLPGFSVHGIFQARILEWLSISFSRRSWPRDWTRVSCIVGRCFTVWATREVHRWKKETDLKRKQTKKNKNLCCCDLALLFFQFSSVAQLCLTVIPWTAACQASLSITNSQSLLKLLYIELVMPSNHLILWHPLLLLSSILPSIRVFSNESALHNRWLKYWSFSFCITPSSEYSGLISFRMDWFDLFAVQGTLKGLLFWTPQFKSINSSVLSFLYIPSLTSIHDYWKNHSFD